VDFMEGDPDWPIIVGSVYNEANQPIYDLKSNKTQSGIKTRSYPEGPGFNELRFEDKKGEEHIYLQGEKDWNILIKNDKGQNVGHDETLSVANNRTKTVGVNQSETIGAN
jgi:type VI secretion system secreted protein VgrG